MMHDLQLSRDKAIEKLQQTRSALGNNSKYELKYTTVKMGIICESFIFKT